MNYCPKILRGQAKIVVILGPTASGKSDLAVKLAKKFNGEVVSADSRQVYKKMDIGTGKITKKEMAGVSHHMLDVASPKNRFDVARYQKMAHKKIADILKRGKLPIVCGGTGLYIKAIVENPSYPDIPPDWRLREQLDKKTAEQLFAMLKKFDPERARNIDARNPRRLIRAIEIAKHSGNPRTQKAEQSSYDGNPRTQRAEQSSYDGQVPTVKTAPKYDALILGVKPSQKKLKSAIKARLQKRIKQGMIAEVKKLRARGISWRRLEELGLEYKYAALYLQNKMGREEMIKILETKINQYAKRQITWFKKTPNARWIKNYREAVALIKDYDIP